MRIIRTVGWIALYGMALTSMIIYSLLSDVKETNIAEPETVSLTFRHLWTKEHDRPILDIFQDVVSQYQADHPHVNVHFEGLDQTIHREQKLKSEMVTGTPPDMFVLFGGAELEPYARSERLIDLTEFAAKIKPEFRDLHLWTFDDRVYGLPFEGHAEPLYYNREIFAKLGIEVPKTLEELLNVVHVLSEHGYIPFALGNEDLWPGAIFAHYMMDRYAGPDLIEQLAYEGKGEFVNEAYIQAFDTLRYLSEIGAFNEDASSVGTVDAIRMFIAEEAAMYVNGSWDITMFRGPDVSPDFEEKIGVIPFPGREENRSRSITGGYTIGIALSSNMKVAQKEAALGLLEAIYTEEVQSRIVYEGERLPALAIPLDQSLTGPVYAQLYMLMEQTEDTFIAYDNVLSPEVTKTFLTVVDQVLNLRITSEEALAQLDEASRAYWKLRESR